jgi:predicted aspartyl protease
MASIRKATSFSFANMPNDGSCGLVVATLICLCIVAPASGQRGAPAPNLAIDDGRQWFEPGAEASTGSAVRKGALATAFNEGTAEKILLGVIRAAPRSEEASQAHELLSRIYLRSGQYAHATENLDRWAESFPNRREVLSEKSDIEQFRGLPDQHNGPVRVLTLSHDADDWSLPVSIDGKSASYLFDSGAWISVMSDAEAMRLGLTIRAGSGRIGDSSGTGFRARTAVAREIRLGAMRFQNVSFAVVPNKEPFGILGMPIWAAVRHVRWSNRGTWELGGRGASVDRGSRNVVFSGNHLLLATSVSGMRVFGNLDTGAIDTDLNANFSDQFPALIQQGTKETRAITGLGGTASFDSVTVPEVPFQIGSTRVVLRPAHVTLQRNGGTGGNCCVGNIGLDILAQTGEFELDLSAMVLRLP